MAWFDYLQGIGSAAAQGVQQFEGMQQQKRALERQRQLDILALRDKQRELLKEQWAQTLPGQEFTAEEVQQFLPIVGKSAFEPVAGKAGTAKRRITPAEQMALNKLERDQQQLAAQQAMTAPEFASYSIEDQLRIASIAEGKAILPAATAQAAYERSPEGIAQRKRDEAEMARSRREAAARLELETKLENLRTRREEAKQRFELMGKSMEAAIAYKRDMDRINAQTAGVLTKAWVAGQVTPPATKDIQAQYRQFLTGASDDLAGYAVVPPAQ